MKDEFWPEFVLYLSGSDVGDFPVVQMFYLHLLFTGIYGVCLSHRMTGSPWPFRYPFLSAGQVLQGL